MLLATKNVFFGENGLSNVMYFLDNIHPALLILGLVWVFGKIIRRV